MSREYKSQEEMLLDIDATSFAVVEMTEYLDTHPYEKAAIDYVNYYIQLKNKLVEEYSYLYGPLCLSISQKDTEKWKWALTPMPWEGGCQ